MHTDSFLAKGSTHAVCQDYTRTGSWERGHYLIVSDGCSQSPDTDVGARLWTLHAESRLRQSALGLFHIGSLTEQVSETAKFLGLPPECLDATFLMAVVDRDVIRVVVAGDGVVAALRKDGAIESWSVSYPLGAPGYLSYRLDDARCDTWENGWNTRLVEHTLDGEIVSTQEEKVSRNHMCRMWEVDVSDYLHFAIMSDGIQSFRQRQTEVFNISSDGEVVIPNAAQSLIIFDGRCRGRRPLKSFQDVPLRDVLPHLMEIPSPGGAFMQRRAKRFLTSHCTKSFWDHTDDLAIASLWVG